MYDEIYMLVATNEVSDENVVAGIRGINPHRRWANTRHMHLGRAKIASLLSLISSSRHHLLRWVSISSTHPWLWVRHNTQQYFQILTQNHFKNYFRKIEFFLFCVIVVIFSDHLIWWNQFLRIFFQIICNKVSFWIRCSKILFLRRCNNLSVTVAHVWRKS